MSCSLLRDKTDHDYKYFDKIFNFIELSVDTFLDNLGNISKHISNSITNWFNYRYDGRNSHSISDGGQDMFDEGNIVSENLTLIFMILLSIYILNFIMVKQSIQASYNILKIEISLYILFW